MLYELSIKNFAIIDDLNIRFSDGVTIMSGETGAGKSIIINAFNLLLGKRATTKLIRTNFEAAEIEACFRISTQSKTFTILKQLSLENDDNLIIRRIINKNNRHKIYINGHATTINILKNITNNLATISGQHAHQTLLDEEQPLLILDQFASLTSMRQKISDYFYKIISCFKDLIKYKKLLKNQKDNLELLEFQKNEILNSDIQEKEDEILENELFILKNSKKLHELVYTSIDSIYNRQGSIIEQISEVNKKLAQAANIDNTLTKPFDELSNAFYQIEDVNNNLQNYLQNIQIDENKLEKVEARLDKLLKLKRKYGGPDGGTGDGSTKTIEAIFEYLKNVEKQLSENENFLEKINKIQDKLNDMHFEISKLSKEISEKRKKAALILSKKIEKELSFLNMPNTKFEIFFKQFPATNNTNPYLATPNSQITETGFDQISFLLSPNTGEAPKPLATIASGGELSRVILALKAILAQKESCETIVFDEVDAGIGGKVAELVGKKIKNLSKFHQIICITHLPQIAKFGNHHLKIIKLVENNKTITKVKHLNKEQKVDEIARMLGGIKITDATIKHAREILEEENS